jgi:hypothetical protein
LLLNNPAPVSIVNLAQITAGHDRNIKLRYMKRGTPDQASDTPGCDAGDTASYDETTLAHALFRKMSFYISNEELEQYYDDATKSVLLGNAAPAGGILAEMYNRVIVKLNGLIGAIDIALLTEMVTKWGVNAATGLSTATAINFSTLNNVSLTDGIVKLIDQAEQNEIAGQLLMVGNGVANTYQIAQALQSAANASGYDANRWSAFRWFNDQYSAAVWGANHFGVIAQGAAGFVDWNKNLGYSAGTQGTSYFFTINVPVILDGGNLTNLVFDAQLKSIDCATEIDGTTRERGYILYLTKNFGLFTTPDDAYETSDLLTGANGLIHYVAAAS